MHKAGIAQNRRCGWSFGMHWKIGQQPALGVGIGTRNQMKAGERNDCITQAT
jgi:hypothetical protein